MSDVVTQLRDIAEVQTGPFGTQLHAADYAAQGTPIITVEHLAGNKISHKRVPLVGESDAIRLSRYRVQEGDLVFSRVGAIDRCALVSREEREWLFSGRLLRVRPTRSKVDPDFLAQALNHELSQRWIRNHAVGSTMPCLNTSILGLTPVFLLPLPEQRRVARILRTVDDTISSTERLIAKLEDVRQGVAQDLFTGRARFVNDAQAAGRIITPREWIYGRLANARQVPNGWRIVRLTEVARLETGHTPDRKVPSYWNGSIPWLSLHDTSRLDRRELYETALLITEAGLRHSSARILPAKTVALSRTATVGKCVILGREMATSQDFACYVCGPTVEPWFLMQLFRHMQPVWRRLAGGSTHQTVYMPVFERLQVLLPPLSEQREIASAIETAEAQIDAVAVDLAKLRALRQGLADDLLAGRVRVRIDDGGAS